MKKWIAVILSSILLVLAMLNQVIAAPVFTDTVNHWGREYIDFLTANGAIKGYTDDTFKPNNKISRAEFTAILLRALNNDAGQPEDGEWYDNYITEAVNRKYITAGEFDDVEKNITRGEMARMIVRTMAEGYPENMAEYTSQLTDYSKTPAEYKDFVLKAYVKGIITGRPGGIFAYADSATRAEATTMIVRLIDKAKRVMPVEPEKTDDIYIYEIGARKEVKVTSSHEELMDAIKIALKVIPIDDELSDIYYSKEGNSVHFYWYTDKEEREKSILERVPVISYIIYTEYDPRSEGYRPYSLSLYDTTNTLGQEKFKTLAREIFPGAYDKIEKELKNKISDTNYQGKVWEKIKGREIRIFTFSGKNKISMYTELRNR